MFFLVLCLAIVICNVNAAFWNDTMSTKDDLLFVDRFAFAFDGPGSRYEGIPSHINYTVWAANHEGAAVEAKSLRVCLYWGPQWQRVYENKTMSCEEKIAADKQAKCSHVAAHGSSHSVKVSNPHFGAFWYVAVLNCAERKVDEKEWSVAYRIHAINPGGHWNKEFGYDEWGMGKFSVWMTLFYVILAIVHVYAVIQLRALKSYHVLIRLLTVCIVAELVISLINFMHFSVYAGDGVGLPRLHTWSELIDMYVQICFMLLIMLVAHGWAISTNQIRNRKPLTVAFALLIFFSLVLFVWERAFRDRASRLYAYQSVPGALLLATRTAMCIWFCLAVRATIAAEPDPEKRTFYFRFGFLYGMWLASMQLIVIVGAFFIDDIHRAVYVYVNHSLADFLAFVILSALMWPTIAHKFFDISSPDLLFGGAARNSGSSQSLVSAVSTYDAI